MALATICLVLVHSRSMSVAIAGVADRWLVTVLACVPISACAIAAIEPVAIGGGTMSVALDGCPAGRRNFAVCT